MYTSRSPFRTMVLVGLGILLGAALFGGTGAAATVVAAPLIVIGFLFKVALFLMLFGFVAKLVGGGWRGNTEHRDRWARERREWRRRHGVETDDEAEDESDRFEAWHRMAHARQEVDDHTPPVED